jgi:Mor family transcriptional regulator
MLDDIPNDSLASLENCTLDEVISILQNYACDPIVNSNQVGSGSSIANHVIKEKFDRYHKESMVSPKLGDI